MSPEFHAWLPPSQTYRFSPSEVIPEGLKKAALAPIPSLQSGLVTPKHVPAGPPPTKVSTDPELVSILRITLFDQSVTYR